MNQTDKSIPALGELESLKQKLGYAIAHGTYFDEEAREELFTDTLVAFASYLESITWPEKMTPDQALQEGWVDYEHIAYNRGVENCQALLDSIVKDLRGETHD